MEVHSEKSWFSRHWPWVVPLGCCSGCFIAFLLFVLGLGGALWGVVSEFTDALPVEDAISMVNNDDRVLHYLGDAIESNGFPNGNFSLQDDDGQVDFTLPIKGTKGTGTLVVKGIRTKGVWSYEELYVIVDTADVEINILDHEKMLESI